MEGSKRHYALYTVVWLVCSLPVLGAEICEFYKKIFDMDWSKWNASNIGKNNVSFRYRINRSTWYCAGSMYCCGRDCCHDPSYYDSNQGRKSTTSAGTVVGAVVGGTVGVCALLLCCMAFRKIQRSRDTAIPMRVTYSDTGTAVIRQRYPDEAGVPPVPTIHDRQDISRHSPSSVHNTYVISSPQDIPESNVPQHGYDHSLTHSTTLDAPPPSYEYVMSHDVPVDSNKN
ncbi:uncharacterized protein LOC125658200 [Ostrea edulis]|uniref:uncharacterized protein LOC125658200 n=1 Tax=Ostrea edulis TaxID=37623 RepID=UPI0024AFCC63|nr:uncharacterized protein LOC125658200 [Ostrea edulis]